MRMAVVRIRVMGMAMDQLLVAVGMRMRLRDRPVMAVPVMLVMDMGVLMLDGVMDMRVVVALGEMRPQA